MKIPDEVLTAFAEPPTPPLPHEGQRRKPPRPPRTTTYTEGVTVNDTGGDIRNPNAYDPEFRGAFARAVKVTRNEDNAPVEGPTTKPTRSTPTYQNGKPKHKVTKTGKMKALTAEEIRKRGKYGY